MPNSVTAKWMQRQQRNQTAPTLEQEMSDLGPGNAFHRWVDPKVRSQVAQGMFENAAPGGLSELLAKFEQDQTQLMKVFKAAQMFGQDTASIAPFAKKLMEQQMQQMQQAVAQGQMLPSATAPQVNIPQPMMPRVR